ncbi:uncharacterized protein LOC136089431 isoform X2 [Hydra vulgaris]|uniref:Uncharacterized protein LOC136089431 isoform X2 n=1 Tax=Hydra vulgaris TaxID=6087 RepID=A0ABM4DAW1_HYDVU
MFSSRLPVCSSEYKENIEEAQQKQKRYYDERVEINTKIEEEFIAIGDKALLLDIRGKRSKGAAFKPRFKGPYYVLSVTKCGNFKLTGENKVPLKGTHKRLHIKKFIESKDKDPLQLLSEAINEKTHILPEMVEGKINTQKSLTHILPRSPFGDFWF